MSHPWIWLNEPQHGTAVQAVTSIVASLAAIVAAIYAIRAYRSARIQAVAAVEQTAIVREQARRAEQQYDDQRKELIAERALVEAREAAVFKRKVAEEEAGRPRWQITYMTWLAGGEVYEVRYTNAGKTAALNAEVWSIDLRTMIASRPLCVPESSVHQPLKSEEVRPTDVVIKFDTAFGSRWAIRFTRIGHEWNEEVLDVERSYKIIGDD